MLKLCSILMYIVVVLLQKTTQVDDFADKLFERIDAAHDKAADVIPKEILPEQFKLVTDGSKKLAAGMKTTMNKITKWQMKLMGKTDDLKTINEHLRKMSGNINKAADFNNLRKKDPDLDLVEVLTDCIDGFKEAVIDFINSLRTKSGQIRTSAEDVTKSFESASDLFDKDMNKVSKNPHTPIDV